MFKIVRKKDETPTQMEEVQKTVLTELENRVISEDYSKAQELAELYETVTKADRKDRPEMSDQVKVACISAGASLFGILAVIRHEEMNVIASKALGFIVKPKI